LVEAQILSPDIFADVRSRDGFALWHIIFRSAWIQVSPICVVVFCVAGKVNAQSATHGRLMAQDFRHEKRNEEWNASTYHDECILI
jgi:hypothetical protein